MKTGKQRGCSWLKAALLPLLLTAVTMESQAHEYWLEPSGESWASGEVLEADIRNGENFLGSALPFQPEAFTRAGLISETERRSLDGRLGDYPAFRMPLHEAGLHLLLLETSRRELRHEEYSDFEIFLNYHGLQNVGESHQARGLPMKNIVEHYYRYCKALIHVDDPSLPGGVSATGKNPTPALKAQGQQVELVATNNPFLSDSVQLQLLFKGAALPGRQIEMFHRDERQVVTRRVADTDEFGLVEFTTDAAGDYLLNSVMLAEPDDRAAHWETHWASLTFRKQ